MGNKTPACRFRYLRGNDTNEVVIKLHNAANALEDLLSLLALPQQFTAFVDTVARRIRKQIRLIEGETSRVKR